MHLTLLPFGEAALRHFMFLERPEGMDLDDADGLAAYGRAVPAMQQGDIVPRLQDFATVGHLYRSIEAGIAQPGREVRRAVAVRRPAAGPGHRADFRWPELVAVTDAAGAASHRRDPGAGRRGRAGSGKTPTSASSSTSSTSSCSLRAANPLFEPVRPVVPVNVGPASATDIPLVDRPADRQVMDLFNVSYEILLLMLQRYFAHTEETDAQLKTLADAPSR